MPRSKKMNNKGGGQPRRVQPFSDEDASIETLSHCSSFSDSVSVAEEGGQPRRVQPFSDEDASIETLSHCSSFSDSVSVAEEGKGDEQCAAASLACLLCIQLGAGIESEDVFKTLKPIFKNILADGTANIQTRQACATSLGVCSLVAADDILDVYATMECFESLFAKSYVKEDGTRSVNNAQTTVLHINALLSWTLLLTICSNTEVKRILKKYHLYNAAAFKARTKARNKFRDKRVDIGEFI
ncbi:UNVERIFIED_CONTAM: hypothetical protein FKN15_010368 [Acipenser sinensis]